MEISRRSIHSKNSPYLSPWSLFEEVAQNGWMSVPQKLYFLGKCVLPLFRQEKNSLSSLPGQQIPLYLQEHIKIGIGDTLNFLV